LTFDQPALLARLERLKPPYRVCFAVSCAERLLPAYIQYHDVTGQGNPDVLWAALERLRADLSGDELSSHELRGLIAQCEALVPGEEDPWNDWSGLAQNAAAAVAYALRSRLTGLAQEAAWAAVQAYEAADLVATSGLNADFNIPGIEDVIEATDVIQQELALQARDLQDLESKDHDRLE
jgi:uncharacterized protein YjaG (DUF416 family)